MCVCVCVCVCMYVCVVGEKFRERPHYEMRVLYLREV